MFSRTQLARSPMNTVGGLGSRKPPAWPEGVPKQLTELSRFSLKQIRQVWGAGVGKVDELTCAYVGHTQVASPLGGTPLYLVQRRGG